MHSSFTTGSICVLFTLCTLASGCATTWVKRSPKSRRRPPPKTLVASLTITSVGHDQDSVKNISNLIQNDELNNFGPEAFKLMARDIEPMGFRLVLDKDRAVRIGEATFTKNKTVTKLSGQWVHAETSPYSFNGSHYGPSLRNIAKRLRDEGTPSEHFASITMNIYEGSNFACGTFFGWFYPIIAVRIRILNNQGHEVFNARFKGQGESSFGIADRSAKNLTTALKSALGQMRGIEESKL